MPDRRFSSLTAMRAKLERERKSHMRNLISTALCTALAAAAMLFSAPSSRASVLTFEGIPVASDQPMPQAYGDNIDDGGPDGPGYLYGPGTGPTAGYTPNITVTYHPSVNYYNDAAW